MKKITKTQKQLRQARVRMRVRGTSERPRLTVFRSNQHFYGQLIDDAKRVTIVSISDHAVAAGKSKGSHVGVPQVRELGTQLAALAIEKGVKAIVFDRGSYRYHGRVKAFAEGAREGGLEF